ncbi:hypothetical protein [Microbacterium sp.]|uniref:hypothetical protein n=1 Tax=Microbacterium sp. TaxID=51671 RepID=UPI003A8EB287
MTLASRSARALGALSAGLLSLGMLAACAPQPQPTSTPTKTALFSSDAEAFKAAEETYRAYTDASNDTNLSDPTSIDPVYEWLTNPAEAASRKNYSVYYAEKISRTGESTYDHFTPVAFKNGLITARVCVDVSAVDLVDADGQSVVPTDRVDRQPLEIEFVEGDTPTSLVIRSNIVAEGFKC